MSIFAEQVPRLLGPRINTVQDLKEAIAAIFMSDLPVVATSGLEVSNPNGSPPITVTTNETDNNTVVPPIVFNIGGIQVPTVPLPPGTQPISTTPSGGGGNAFAGQVQSGSGSLYQVTIWSGPVSGAAAGTVGVQMLGMSSDAKMLPGSWVIVLKLGPQFVGLPFVFYGPPP